LITLYSKLDQDIASGNLRLVEEKKAIAEMSQLKSQKRILENLLNGGEAGSDIQSVQGRLDVFKAEQVQLDS
jgi:hypothetical protein